MPAPSGAYGFSVPAFSWNRFCQSVGVNCGLLASSSFLMFSRIGGMVSAGQEARSSASCGSGAHIRSVKGRRKYDRYPCPWYGSSAHLRARILVKYSFSWS